MAKMWDDERDDKTGCPAYGVSATIHRSLLCPKLKLNVTDHGASHTCDQNPSITAAARCSAVIWKPL